LRIKTLKINNIRNIKTLDLDVHPAYNLITGDNGAGKTSILESMVLLAKGRSFRSGHISNVIGPVEKIFRVVSDLSLDNGMSAKLGLERDTEGFRARLDGRDITQISELTRLMPHVLVEPNSHLLVSGAPEGRRKFVDWGVFHVEQNYLDTWRRYSRALKQRNAALRTMKREMVSSLDPVLTRLAGVIDRNRKKFIENLAPILNKRLESLDGRLGDLKIRYRQGWQGDSLESALQSALERDFERGSTSEGPHRADLKFVKKGVVVREQFSRGEQKALSAALLLTQAELMADSGENPLLLLDDIASEFDDTFLSRILSVGEELGLQTWITGVSAEAITRHRTENLRWFHVKHGCLESVQDARSDGA
jgi:DNA replication and repair protein RecF